MALILSGRTLCPLCETVIRETDQIVSTSHFIGDEEDPLWLYSDAGMHKVCFLSWELKAMFVTRYNDAHKSVVWGNGTRFQMEEDGAIIRVAVEN